MAFLNRRVVRLVALVSSYVVYLSMGAMIFSAIERPLERQEVTKLRALRESFLERNKCVDVQTKSKCYFMEPPKYGSIENVKCVFRETGTLSLPVYVPLEFQEHKRHYFSATHLFILYFVLYFAYLVTGAMVFSTVEYPEEQKLLLQVEQARQRFFTLYPQVKDEDLESLISEVVRASNRGVSASRNVSGQSNWSFGQSLFFSGTIVTTIGYGHVTPLSRSGKVFCIIFAAFGIPLTLVLLTALVERLLKPTMALLQWLNSQLGHLYQPFNIRVFHLFIIVTLLIVVGLLIPAAIFARIEPEWDFLDSFYYCFISITTIGLGDYIPGDYPNQQYRPLYKIATTVYLLLGLTLMMLTLSVFYDIPQLNLGTLFKSPDSGDSSEKARLANCGVGLNYGIDADSRADENMHRHVVRVRSRHRDDSPSPEEPTPPPTKSFRLP